MPDRQRGCLATLVLWVSLAVPLSALADTRRLIVDFPADGAVTSVPAGIACGGRNGRSCLADFATGTTVTLTASSATQIFSGWGGDCSGDLPVCQLTMSDDRSVSASFEPVVLDVAVTGYGRVTSAPSGISCPHDCGSTYPIGSTITLTASADPDEQFLGWGGACSGTGACVVALDSSLSVTAAFTENTRFFDLVVTAPENGSITSTPSGLLCGAGTRNDCQRALAEGSQEVLLAVPTGGYEFAGWGGDCAGTAESCVLLMNGNKQVSASFAVTNPEYTLAVSVAGNGSVTSSPGNVDCPGLCSGRFPQDTTVRLSASPQPGESFLGWGGSCSGTGSCDVAITGYTTVSAEFSSNIVRYPLSVDITGQGSVTSTPAGIDCGDDGRGARSGCLSSFADGTVVALTATPLQGYRFAGWSGACSGAHSCSVTMSAAQSVTATFVAVDQEYTLSVSVRGNGSIDSSPGNIDCPGVCTDSYTSGARVELTPVPLFGETFVGWEGDCSGTGSCVPDLTANRFVIAVFSDSKPVYRLTPQTTTGGEILRNPVGLACGRRTVQYCYTAGTPLTLTAVAASGYVFSAWSGPCGDEAGCSLSMDGDRTISASFAPDPDTDGDGTPDSVDTDDDDDGYTDAEEVEWGTDPRDPGDLPAAAGINPVIFSILAGGGRSDRR